MRYKGLERRHAGWRSLWVLSVSAFHVTQTLDKAEGRWRLGRKGWCVARASAETYPGLGTHMVWGSESYCTIRKTAQIIEYVRLFRRAFAIRIVCHRPSAHGIPVFGAGAL